MLLYLAIAAVAPVPAVPAVRADRAAMATVRILAPGRSTPADWSKAPPSRRKEILLKEADGRIVSVRLIEFE